VLHLLKPKRKRFVGEWGLKGTSLCLGNKDAQKVDPHPLSEIKRKGSRYEGSGGKTSSVKKRRREKKVRQRAKILTHIPQFVKRQLPHMPRGRKGGVVSEGEGKKE